MSDNSELRRLARGGVGGLLAAVVTGLGGLGFILVAAWGFPKAEVGIVFTQTSLFLIALAVVTLGSDVGVVRFVAIKLEARARHDVGAVMTATLAPVVVLALVVSTTLWFTIPLLPFSQDFVRTGQVMALFLPFAAVSNLVLAGTRGLGSVRPTILVESLLRQGLQPLLAATAALLSESAVWLALAWVVPYAVSSIAGVVSYHRLCGTTDVSSFAWPRSEAVRAVRREVWAFNAPRALTQIAQIGIRRADIPIVAALVGPAAAAVYTASSRFVAAGLQAVKGIQQMVGPQIARLYAAGNVTQAGMSLRAATTWNVLIAWPMYLTCAVIPSVVLLIFGKGYESGTPVVVILALGMLVGIAAGPVDIALLMLGRSVQSLRNNMAALITNLALNLALVPVLGISGAAVAWSASILVSNALPTWQIRPILGNASDRNTLLAAGMAVVSFAVPPLVTRLAGFDDPLPLVASSVLGGLVYLGLVHRFRRPLHVRELAAAVRRRRDRSRVTQDPARG
jgi:O-antigen/teichoic acid export membrane protein